MRNKHILQAQVKALVLGIVWEEEEGPKAQCDEGTENEEENELLRKPQSSPMVWKRGGAW